MEEVDVVLLAAGRGTRLESVMAGMQQVKTGRVMIHLAAMPSITKDLVDRLIQYDEPAVIPAIRPGPTVSQGDEFMEGKLDRSRLRVIQMPQLFDTQILRRAHQKAMAKDSDATEDGHIVFDFGAKVRFVRGSEQNVDIKTPLDFFVAECLRKSKLMREAVTERPQHTILQGLHALNRP